MRIQILISGFKELNKCYFLLVVTLLVCYIAPSETTKKAVLSFLDLGPRVH